jgi:uncharacterized protein (DUF433 family)
MLLEDYFDFLEPDVIRIKGHRIGIEDVLEMYHRGYPPELIADEFGTLTYEEVYATLTYYWRNKAEVDAYLERLRLFVEESIREFESQEPSEAMKRIRALREARAAYNTSE